MPNSPMSTVNSATVFTALAARPTRASPATRWVTPCSVSIPSQGTRTGSNRSAAGSDATETPVSASVARGCRATSRYFSFMCLSRRPMPVERPARSKDSVPLTDAPSTANRPSIPSPFPWMVRALGQPTAVNSTWPPVAVKLCVAGTGRSCGRASAARAGAAAHRIPQRAKSAEGRCMLGYSVSTSGCGTPLT